MSIDLTVRDRVALLTINRPERLNAMDAEHYQALSECWMRVRDDPEIRVAVVTSMCTISMLNEQIADFQTRVLSASASSLILRFDLDSHSPEKHYRNTPRTKPGHRPNNPTKSF